MMSTDIEQFAEYVREFREFSETYRVPCGRPENLHNLLQSLKTDQVFSEDFESMIRVVVLRERFLVTPSELVVLVTVAWGGAEIHRPTQELQSVLLELESILRVLKDSASKSEMPVIVSAEAATIETSGGVDDTSSGLKESREDSEPVPTAFGFESHAAKQDATELEEASKSKARAANDHEEVLAETQMKHEQESGHEDSSLHLGWERSVQEKEHTGSSLSVQASGYHTNTEASAIQSRVPTLTEVLALGLAGLVAALLVMTPSIPVYRARVSVYLPSQPTAMADQSGSNAANMRGSISSSEEELLRSGKLTEQVTKRFLLQAYPNPMFRQDVLSRGLRDLHIGGRDTILYATLVVETARRVKVRQLQTQGLYEITCDSWSSQFAAAFCNELGKVMDQQLLELPGSQLRANPTHKSDTAVGPGIQILPHWYLGGAIGFAGGCLIAALLGLVKPRRSAPIS
jgi:hypothetical protein